MYTYISLFHFSDVICYWIVGRHQKLLNRDFRLRDVKYSSERYCRNVFLFEIFVTAYFCTCAFYNTSKRKSSRSSITRLDEKLFTYLESSFIFL